MMNVVNGGCHSRNLLDFQEFMIMPSGACCFSEGLRMGAEIYHQLKKLLDEQGLSTGIGDEGGFAPDLKDAEEVFQYLDRASRAAGYEPGKDLVFAMDAAASELYDKEKDAYAFPGESRMKGERIFRSSGELVGIIETHWKIPTCQHRGWSGGKMTGRAGKQMTEPLEMPFSW